MAKRLLFDDKAKAKLLKGVNIVASAVGATLGPKANNVAIQRPWGIPSVLHDGVSIAKEIELEDEFANLGAQLVIEASAKTNDQAGDGTTTAAILTQALVKQGFKNIAAGANAMMIRRGIERAVQ